MPFVLDCSVALAWVMPDEADQQVDVLLDRLLDDSAVVPELWSLEVGNVLLVARRRNRITDDEQTRIVADLCNLPVETDRRTHEYVFSDTMGYASKFDLTLYDACYIELALRRHLPLATLDRKLIHACKSAGIEIL